MKKVSIKDLSFIPASHEDINNPSVYKKTLFTYKDIIVGGRIQMINWAVLASGKTFASHYHEDMEEIFILITGKVKVKIGPKHVFLSKGEAVLVPIGSIHQMKNVGRINAEYLVIGVSLAMGGETVNV